MANHASQITAVLTSTKCLTPTAAWLSTILSTQRPNTPLPALTQSACFRILASDITNSITTTPSTCYPTNLHDVTVKERRLAGPIPVQVLAVEDLGKSRWEQVEAIEALERGEGTKGREIIRVAAPEENNDSGGGVVQPGSGPHKLLLQDAKGTRIYGIELKLLDGIGLGMGIGCKLILKQITVARGVVLLEPATTTVLGGKIDVLHKAWKEGRKAELRRAIEESEQAGV